MKIGIQNITYRSANHVLNLSEKRTRYCRYFIIFHPIFIKKKSVILASLVLIVVRMNSTRPVFLIYITKILIQEAILSFFSIIRNKLSKKYIIFMLSLQVFFPKSNKIFLLNLRFPMTQVFVVKCWQINCING